MADYTKIAAPTDEQEAANAAYTWAVECWKDCLKRLAAVSICTEQGWAEAKWHWDRLERAVMRERELDAKAKEARNGAGA